MTGAKGGGTNLPRVVPVQARLEVEQPLYDHVDRLRLEPILRLSLRRVLIEAGLRHADFLGWSAFHEEREREREFGPGLGNKTESFGNAGVG